MFIVAHGHPKPQHPPMTRRDIHLLTTPVKQPNRQRLTFYGHSCLDVPEAGRVAGANEWYRKALLFEFPHRVSVIISDSTVLSQEKKKRLSKA